jgi:ketosteroid isomerase-like protein
MVEGMAFESGAGIPKRTFRSLIDRWTAAVRRHDCAGILADHDTEIMMFDVPPPLQVKGMED